MGLAAAGGADHEDVALLKLHIISAAKLDSFIVVVDRHRQGHLGIFLANDVLVQNLPDLPGDRQLVWQVRRDKPVLPAQLFLQHAHA